MKKILTVIFLFMTTFLHLAAATSGASLFAIENATLYIERKEDSRFISEYLLMRLSFEILYHGSGEYYIDMALLRGYPAVLDGVNGSSLIETSYVYKLKGSSFILGADNLSLHEHLSYFAIQRNYEENSDNYEDSEDLLAQYLEYPTWVRDTKNIHRTQPIVIEYHDFSAMLLLPYGYWQYEQEMEELKEVKEITLNLLVYQKLPMITEEFIEWYRASIQEKHPMFDSYLKRFRWLNFEMYRQRYLQGRFIEITAPITVKTKWR